jgi:leader peptidase (prepilin peptidase) / N-methyltransferase
MTGGNLLHDNLRPDLAILAGGSGAVAVASALMLPWPAAAASIVLGVFMIAGAEVDARVFLLPDVVTWGAVGSGIIAAAALDPHNAWRAIALATARAAGTAFALASLRWCYTRLRTREGLGFGDVKLAAAVGAWLPLGTIPLCFSLAAGAALVAVLIAHWRGQLIDKSTRVPFGAFLCPALWLVFYANVLPS